MASESADNKGIKQHIPLLTVLMLGTFLAVLNQTLLNVAIPPLINEFDITASTAEWLLTGYMLVNGMLIPLSAYLIDRFGVRLLFLLAMFFFTSGSLICGLAPTFSVMLAGRLIQAVGAGIIMPLVMTIILFVFPPEVRGKGMGLFGLGMMFAPAIGPTLSGWVIENYSWRLLFDGIVPLGVIVLVVASFLLRDVKERKKLPFDFWGTFTSTLGFGTFLYGLNQAGSDGWTDPVVLACLVTGVFLVSLFVIQQLNSKRPMLDFRVFKYDIFSLSSIINVIVTIAMFSGMFLLPIYLQNLRGFTPLEAGLLMLPGAVVMGIMSPISGSLFDKLGPRPLAVVGMLITTVTTYEFTRLSLDTSYTFILTLNMIRAFGMSLLMMPIMTAGLNQLPPELNSHGTATSNTMRQVSGSIGISLMTSIFTMRSSFHLGKLSEQADMMNPAFSEMFQSVTNAFASVTGMQSAQAKEMVITMLYGQANMQSAVSGINDTFLWATGFSFAGFILSFFLRDVRKDKPKETTVKEPVPSPVAEPGAKEPVLAGMK
ncbi:DHA2 family efflux MFS transporter permease subunit [Paenactinomyces guangxiensis]|uniref:DHA2 family efflux MFS transporter permease subunit n=1 Tax=Paenactinomyces guangxiensis TaxID=1490290 RepID=A0A7W1WQ00_9BACL|nr:DHA2 family efflux MFS transporter permease subunit [Paenactinomyces guangxiensis]MBA4493956.1 DHA2 family efflux MFS transporter permease subunit [Paenactinomyces guangxiensis]MBH8591423.1 DHA2 family efflux MFS transporter permease subunit [Paenactinomyces guangxiensis]